MDVEEETAILGKNKESILINLTNNLEGDKISMESAKKKQNFVVRCIPRNPSENDENNINDEAGEQNDAKTQIEIINEEFVEQKPHLILLRRHSDTNTSEKNVEAVEIKTGFTEQKIINKTQIEKKKEKPKGIPENETHPDNSQGDSDNANEESFETNAVKIIVNDKTIKVRKEVNIKMNEENPEKEVKNESETNMGQCNTAKKNNSPKETQNMGKVTENESVIIVNKNVVEYVGDTINKSENTQTNNDTKNKPRNTKSTNNTKNYLGNKSKTSNNNTTNEPVNTSKTNKETKYEPGRTSNTKNAIGNKANLTAQRTALAVLLKQRIFEYLHKEIKIIQHIHLGKYSNIFSCTDSEGRSYAAKVLTYV